ncbi:MAG: hypothetical protein V1664_00770 [Candidatus Uhrbacteria bacterium]
MHFKRLFLFWLINFAFIYGLNLLAVSAWMIFDYNNAFLMMAMVNVPLATLFFGWLYFRPGFAIKLSQRIKNAIVWIALDFLGSMLVLAITPNIGALEAFSTSAYTAESFNFLALLVASYVALKQPKRFAGVKPPSLVPPRPEQE